MEEAKLTGNKIKKASKKKNKRKLETQDNSSNITKKAKYILTREQLGIEYHYDASEYYFENGLRKIYPYFYTFTTYCKGRWINMKLIDVFAKEFLAQPVYEFENSIKKGLLTVNGEEVKPEYILKNGDLIANRIHRHEVPVTDKPLKIISLTEDLVVIDKPSSIPAHPSGRYRFNTVVFILAKDFNLPGLRIAYRLDRLTSGLMMFSRNLERDKQLKDEIKNRSVQKRYLSRVQGVFPEDPVLCKEPIAVFSHQIGICRVDPNGKECETEFERWSTNGKTSVVLCKPKTGRMHQIRVHLQYLGYPIVNDPLYNHPAFGPDKGKNGNINKTEKELVRDLAKDNPELRWFAESDSTISGLEVCPESLGNSSTEKEPCATVDSKHFDPNCGLCLKRTAFQEPTPSQLIMYLHCWKYQGPDWKYETDIPDWAKEDWVDTV
ncbi:hypothetical protein CHUAL_010911 [Chamberlinius hualienensis]